MASELSKGRPTRQSLLIGKRGVEGKGIPMNVNRTTRAMVVILQVIAYVKRKSTARRLGTAVQLGGQNDNSEKDKTSSKVRFAVVNLPLTEQVLMLQQHLENTDWNCSILS